LLGWIAGEIAVADVSVRDWIAATSPQAHWLAPTVGVVIVVLAGMWLARRQKQDSAAS
jgi:hypothetical protein